MSKNQKPDWSFGLRRSIRKRERPATIERRMERDGLWVMRKTREELTRHSVRNENSVSLKHLLFILFSLYNVFFFFVPVLKVVLKTSVAK